LLDDGRGLVGGIATAYVCRGYSCRQPVTRPEQVRDQMASLA
jgi:hypothetical protein